MALIVLLIRPSNSVEVSHSCAKEKAQGWGTQCKYLRGGSMARPGKACAGGPA